MLILMSFDMSIELYLGIDPAWRSLGFGLVKFDTETKDISRVHSQVFNISGYKSITEAVKAIAAKFVEYAKPFLDAGAVFKGFTMERFIAYKNVDSAEFEIINRIIGALAIYFETNFELQTPTRLERAIDWKMNLVKSLHINKQFQNPSNTLDKKFSLAAGKAVLSEPVEYKTDHEADAVCLAALPIYVKRKIL